MRKRNILTEQGLLPCFFINFWEVPMSISHLLSENDPSFRISVY